MKNPFEKSDHKVLIAGVIFGSLAAGAAAYLFLTKSGGAVRQEIAGHFNRLLTAFTGGEQEPAEDHTRDYLQHPVKKPKTDREALLKHEIIGGGHPEHEGEKGA
ncbi:MAG: hypothetical protein JO080_09070 [Mucilaginibacter sp.]|nr:hypothetical protein [Mucilaginibacter sp.]